MVMIKPKKTDVPVLINSFRFTLHDGYSRFGERTLYYATYVLAIRRRGIFLLALSPLNFNPGTSNACSA